MKKVFDLTLIYYYYTIISNFINNPSYFFSQSRIQSRNHAMLLIFMSLYCPLIRRVFSFSLDFLILTILKSTPHYVECPQSNF